MILRWLLILLLIPAAGFCQPAKHHFSYSDEILEHVIADIEKKFDVKYSYIADIATRKISIVAGDYTLEEINAAVGSQALLSVKKIDSRYYALTEMEEITPLDEVVIQGFLSKGITKLTRHFAISPRKVEELPGVTDADVLFSLQQLPGVKSPNETASGLHVRGGTPDQNLVRWDGIRMYHPGHLFGMISGFNPAISQTVTFQNKAGQPRFGERISAIIDIRTADKIDSLTTEAGINGLNTDAYVKIPLSEKLGVQAAGRKSFTEWVQTPTFDALADKVFQHTDFGKFDNDNKFGFQDYSAKITFTPNKKDQLAFSGIAIDNHLDFYSIDGDLGRNQKMDIRNYGFSAHWNHDFGRISQELVVHYSAYTFNYENNRERPEDSYEWFVKKNRVTDSGFELHYDYLVNELWIWNFGYQLSGNDVSHVFLDRFPGFEVELDQSHLMNVSHAIYSDVKFLPRSWVFHFGARYDYFNRLNSDSFQPRLLAQKRFSNAFSAQISFERKSQILSQIREGAASDLSLENYVWILADDEDYPVQRANQVTAGFTFKTNSILVDADAYYKTTDGVTSMAFGMLHEYDTEVHRGSGFTKGIDVLIQKTAPSWRFWCTYTFQDSQNRYEGLNDGRNFPISSDITHALTISFYKKWKRVSFSTGWFWHTGKPYSTLDENNRINSFNSERLPNYHRLDASCAYEFAPRRSWSGKVGLSVLNLYGSNIIISREYERQANGIGELFSGEFTARQYHSLGFTPNIFVRIRF